MDDANRQRPADIAPRVWRPMAWRPIAWRPMALLLVALLILATRLYPLWTGHDPWLDEAMLLANFPLDGPAGLFRPLPLFEQAAPLGYTALLDWIAAAFPGELVTAARAASALASLAAAGLVYATLRRLTAGAETVLALALVCLSPFIIRYSLEIKPYILDYLSTAMVMYAGARLIRSQNAAGLGLFAAAGGFAIAFSFAAPLVIGALGTGVMVQRLADRRPGEGWRALFVFAGVLAGLAALFLVCYLLYTRPVTALQFASWEPYYRQDFLAFPPLSLAALQQWAALPVFLQQQLDPVPGWIYADYPSARLDRIMPVAFWIVAVAGIAAMGRRRVYLPASLGAAAVLVYGLNLVGILPISFIRHYAFLLPITGIIVTCGIVALLRGAAARLAPARRGRLVAAGLAGAVLLVGGGGLYRSGNLAQEEVSPLIAHIAAREAAPVWVYLGAQPAMRVLAPETMRQIGIVDHASDTTAWMWKHRDFPDYAVNAAYLQRFRDSLRGLPAVWLVFAHTWQEQNLPRLRQIAEETVANCREVMATRGAWLWRCG